MIHRAFLVAVCGVILIAGCSAGSPAGEQPSLQATAWTLTALGSGGNMRPALETADVTIEFDADEVSGSAGCNLYFGSYSARKDGTFSVDNVAWTEMACLKPGVMEQEQQFLNTLLQAKSYDVSDDTLTIGGGGGSLVFAPQ